MSTRDLPTYAVISTITGLIQLETRSKTAAMRRLWSLNSRTGVRCTIFRDGQPMEVSHA